MPSAVDVLKYLESSVYLLDVKFVPAFDKADVVLEIESEIKVFYPRNVSVLESEGQKKIFDGLLKEDGLDF